MLTNAEPGQLPADSRRSTKAPKVVGATLLTLFLANTLNFFDRAIPAVVAERIKDDFLLSDLQLGLVAAAFTVVYAVAGLPLGRLADRYNRPRIIGLGLLAWSACTALTGAVGNFGTFLAVRTTVGIGEASFTPAANSIIGDLYPSERRSRALGIFMLGLPVGLIMAFFTVGAIAEAADSWRAPFFVAAVPGIILAIVVLRTRDPQRGQSETVSAATPITQPSLRSVARTLWASRTLRWLTLAGVTFNFGAYAVNSFTVPLLERHYGLSLSAAAGATGLIVGVTGLVGLLLGAKYADRLRVHSPRRRLFSGAVALLVTVPLTALAIAQDGDNAGLFILLFSLGWLLSYGYFLTVYPALHDVVAPRLRATATGVFFALLYLVGGFSGPVVLGAASDRVAKSRLAELGGVLDDHTGAGLNAAFYLVPASMALTALFIYMASRHIDRDSAAMQASLVDGDPA